MSAEFDDDFTVYEKLKRDGVSCDDACVVAAADTSDIAFQIRMLRAVFGLELGAARDVVAMALHRDRG